MEAQQPRDRGQQGNAWEERSWGQPRLRLRAALRTPPDYSLIVSHWTSRLCSRPEPKAGLGVGPPGGSAPCLAPSFRLRLRLRSPSAARPRSPNPPAEARPAAEQEAARPPGGASFGAAGAAASAAPGAIGSATTGAVPAPGAAAAPSGSLSPSTSDVTAGSTIPRARTGSELGLPQPGEGVSGTTGSIGPSTGGTLSPETTRQQNNRDRALDRSLLGGSGICQGC